ncbi:MAG: hypothetical protein FWF10_11755 [Clostridiales bacterium]|nr:hypothetical protein [Clostridiales bacterium]
MTWQPFPQGYILLGNIKQKQPEKQAVSAYSLYMSFTALLNFQIPNTQTAMRAWSFTRMQLKIKRLRAYYNFTILVDVYIISEPVGTGKWL